MTNFIDKAIVDRGLGMALHYPLLHAAVVGLAARNTFEFGAGGSTRVFLDALLPGTQHTSVSTETKAEVASRHHILTEGVAGLEPTWLHIQGLSGSCKEVEEGEALDLILHDGSHAADVVSADIARIWRRLRRFGLLLVHDTQHSYCGEQVREGVRQGLAFVGARYTATTLPYGFGLTIVRKEEDGPGLVCPASAKVGSPHKTVPVAWTS